MTIGDNRAAGRYIGTERLNRDENRPSFKVFDVLLPNWVLIKGDTLNHGTFSSHILKEFVLLRRLNQPWLPQPLHLGQVPWQKGGAHPTKMDYLVESWLGGQNLSKALGTLEPSDLYTLLVQLLEMVATLQYFGLNRLDLKPDHLIWYRGRWNLIDLDQVNQDPVGGWEKTGTPTWSAYEVLAGQAIDHRSDLFSVAMVMWAAATGNHPPLSGATLAEYAHNLKQRGELPLPNKLAALGERVCQVWRRLAALEIQDRPISAEQALEGLGVPPRNWRNHANLPYIISKTQNSLSQHIINTIQHESSAGVWVVGSPRSGLTTLLQEIHQQLVVMGEVCLFVAPSAGDGPVPQLWNYIPVIEQLRHIDQIVWRTPGTWQRDQPTLEAQVSEVAEALVEVVGDDESSHPITIVVDDIEKLDTVSRRALAALSNRLGSHQLRLIVGANSGDVERDFLRLTPISIPPMLPHEVCTLAEELTKAEVVLTQMEAEVLLGETGGTIGKVVVNLEARWKGLSTSNPDEYDDSALQILDQLDSDLRHHAGQISVLEGDFPSRWIHLLVPPRQSSAILAELSRHGVLTRLESEHWQFSQESLRLHLLHELGEDRRLHLHNLVADHLTDNPEAVASPQVVGHHLFYGGKRERAARWYLRAADNHIKENRPDRAAQYLERVLTCLPEGHPDQMVATCRLAEAYQAAGADHQALRVVELSINTPNPEPGPLTRLLGVKGMVLTRLDKPGGETLLIEACARVGSLDPTEGRTLHLAWLHRRVWCQLRPAAMGDRRALRQEANRLLTLAKPLVQSGWEEVDQQYRELWLRQEENPTDPLLEQAFQQAIDLSQKHKYLRGQVLLLTQLVQLLTHLKKRDAIKKARTLLEVARQTFDLRLEVSAQRTLATTLQRLGEASESAAAFERAATLQHLLGNLHQEILCRLARDEVLLDANLPQQVLAPLQQLSELMGKRNPNLAPVLYLRLERAQLHLRRLLGQGDGLRAALLDLRSRCQAPEFRSIELNTCLELAQVSRLEGDRPGVFEWLIHAEKLLGPDDAPEQVKLDHLWNQLLSEDLTHTLGWVSQSPHLGQLPPRFYQVLGRQVDSLSSRTVMDELGTTPRSSVWWLGQLNGLLESSTHPENYVARVVELASSLLGGRGAVILFHDRHPYQVFGSELSQPQVATFSHTILREVLKTRKMAYVPDVALDPILSHASSLRGVGCGVICHPILEQSTVVGAVYLTWDNTVPEGQVKALAAKAAELVESSLRELHQRDRLKTGEGTFDVDFPGYSVEAQNLLQQISRLADLAESSTQVILLTCEDKVQTHRIVDRLKERLVGNTGELLAPNLATMPDDEFDSWLVGRRDDPSRPGWFTQVNDGILHFTDIRELGLHKQKILAEYLRKGTYLAQHEDGYEQADIQCTVVISSPMSINQLEAHKLILPELQYLIGDNQLRGPSLVECGPRTIETLLTVEVLRIRKESFDDEETVQSHPLSTWFNPECCRILRTYNWPGSYTELYQVLRHNPVFIKLVNPEKGLIEPVDLPDSLRRTPGQRGHYQLPPDLTMRELQETLERWQQEYVLAQWQLNACNSVHTAELMDCTRQWVDKQLRNLGVKHASPTELRRSARQPGTMG